MSLNQSLPAGIVIHWHAGHNVAGYLPESDEPGAFTTWRDAMDALVSDLEFAWDDADTMLNGDAPYLDDTAPDFMRAWSAYESAKARLTEGTRTS